MKKKQSFLIVIIFLLGVIFWFLPHSTEIPDKGWQMFSIFLTTIIGIILKPLPIGVLAVFALCASIFTGTLTLDEALSGFKSDISWLVVFAFFISLGFIKTGLGARIGYGFVKLFGKSTLGLSYGLLMSETFLAPAIPSVTARTGGVIFPIAQSLSKAFGSDPELGTERRIGSFLMKTAYQGSTITSAMFLTGMAANPFLVALANDAGFNFSWGQWAAGALVPGILSLITMPLMVFWLYPPEITKTSDATQLATKELKAMGKLRIREWLMLSVFVLLLLLWVFGGFWGIKAASSALLGLCLLLLFGVISWNDVIKEDRAWDTFIWFSILITLAGSLNKLGFTPWLSEQVVEAVGRLHWTVGFLLLFLIYFYSHYFFVSNTAHVGAMFPAFFMVAVGLGTPPYLALAALAYASSLFGGLTHYGSGPAPIYYGSGYIDVKSWWKVGGIVSLVNIFIWLFIGCLWWKILGYW